MNLLLGVSENSAASPLPAWLPGLIVAGCTLGLPLFWFGVVMLLSRLGDWHKLAKKYAAGDRVPSGERRTGVVGWVGVVNYKFTLTVHLAREGFFLETSLFFRPGHPRLFIPWNAISMRWAKHVRRWDIIVLNIGQPRDGLIALALPDELLQPPAT
ncbi:MAG: hypothetical protein ACOYMS_09585 [Terrimicrobiaceae bacterium]